MLGHAGTVSGVGAWASSTTREARVLRWCQSGNTTFNAKADQQLAGLFKELWREEWSPEGCIKMSKTQMRSYGNSVPKEEFSAEGWSKLGPHPGMSPRAAPHSAGGSVDIRQSRVCRATGRTTPAMFAVAQHKHPRPQTKMKICVFSFLCVQLYGNELFKEQKLYLPGVAVWTRVYWCKQVNTGWFLPLIWPSPVNPSPVRGIQPEPEPEPEPKRLSFPSIMPYNPHLSRNRGGISSGGLRDRGIFSRGLHKHTGSRKNLPLIAGNHGNWHQSQETVSRNACAWNHIRAAAAALEGTWRAA